MHKNSVKTVALGIAVAIGSLSATPTYAQTPASGAMGGMSMGKDASSSSKSPSTAAFMAGRQTMMQHMDIPLSGNPDKDFIAGMIPHHQGAIQMAQIELKYGKDPEARRLAQNIIAEQKREIVVMHHWQKKHGAM
ncbi:CopM family metallochaperone [Caballeronia sp. M23-90]